jgi:hypothetical protein
LYVYEERSNNAVKREGTVNLKSGKRSRDDVVGELSPAVINEFYVCEGVG